MTIDNDVTKLIVGASRSESALDDSIVHNALNISSEAESLLFTKIKLRTLFESNQHIDTVLLSLDSRTLDASREKIRNNNYHLSLKISRLSPFISLDEWSEFLKINSSATLKGISNTPKHALTLARTRLSKKEIDITPSDGSFGGYLALNKMLDRNVAVKKISKKNEHDYTISSSEVASLFDIIEYCKSKRICLIFINIPTHTLFKQSKTYIASEQGFNDFRKKNFSNARYLDFSNEIYPDSSYADLYHLNKYGARSFSKKINLVLKNSELFEQYSN